MLYSCISILVVINGSCYINKAVDINSSQYLVSGCSYFLESCIIYSALFAGLFTCNAHNCAHRCKRTSRSLLGVVEGMAVRGWGRRHARTHGRCVQQRGCNTGYNSSCFVSVTWFFKVGLVSLPIQFLNKSGAISLTNVTFDQYHNKIIYSSTTGESGTISHNDHTLALSLSE